MRDGRSDDTIDARLPSELMRAIKVFHFVHGHLARSSGDGDRGIGKRAAVGKRKRARRKTDLAHGDRNASWSLGREAQETHAVANRLSCGGNLDRVGLRVE